MNITVIIPFFQRSPGLLKAALESVLASVGVQDKHHLKIIVIDDESPVSAHSEIEVGLVYPENVTVKIITQPNSGPGAARNTGLNSLDNDIDVVAFLDSDDTWCEPHFANLCKAFDAEADFYFADHQRAGEPLSQFKECSFGVAQATPVGNELYVYTGDLFAEILKRSPVGTSTVAYRFKKYCDVRFMENICAGEDTMFWLDIASRLPRVFFSKQLDVLYGHGVNIFHGVEWGTTTDLARLRDSTIFHETVMTRYRLNDKVRQTNFARLRELEKSFANSLIGAIKHRERSIFPVVLDYFRLRPMFPIFVLSELLWLLKQRFFGAKLKL